MIRLHYKILGVLLLMGAFFSFSANPAYTKDVLEFIDLPAGDDVQATFDALLACRDGVVFDLHTMDRVAHTSTGPHRWDISFARDDGTLLIQEYPLWLSETVVPLVREGRTFPYSSLFTLLWDESLPPQPLITCVSGAGTGFCEFALPIEDCHINTRLVTDIAQIGPEATTRNAVDSLTFEVRAYDPAVGTENGDGIETVEMSIIDPAIGSEVFYVERPTTSTIESLDGTSVIYCAFSEDCQPWVFADHNYTWPSGEPIHNGYYMLRASVTAPGNTKSAVQTQIEVEVPPTFDTVHVPAGPFLMGSETGSPNEKPSQEVELGEFWLMRDEVTNLQYAQCVRAGACTMPADDGRWRDPAYAQHPVTGVDWNQANDFATWAGGRLPTEAEWEKACRGTDGRTFPWGEELPTEAIANFGNIISDTVAVGAFAAAASPFGALDMSGNVWEWTSTINAPYPYVADDGREDLGVGDRRVTRGGSYYYTHYQLTCTFRAPVGIKVSSPQTGLRLAFDHPFEAAVAEGAAVEETEAGDVGIQFTAPANEATVPQTFEVSMVANGLTVEPAGEIHEGAGHFHILIDSDFIEPGELIPFDETHLHFGQGQLATMLELAPGVHTLRLQFANGAHIALEGEQYRDEITVTVE